MTKEALYEYTRTMCIQANEEDNVLDVFWNAVISHPEVMKEYEYYAENNDFLCELVVDGISVTDILVWQIDRFKAAIDEGKFALKYNGPHMVLAAFYTMTDVCDNPGKYKARFLSETGTDYPGKTYLVDKG